MKHIFIILVLSPLILFGQQSNQAQDMDLEALNAYLFKEYALHKNTKPLSDIATDDFVIIAAPGMIENKQQAIDGVVNLNISELNITVNKLIEKDDIGIVIGVLEMKGTIMNRPIPGKMRFSSVFVKVDGVWKLQMRSMTPMRI